jgi:hypothetical protein
MCIQTNKVTTYKIRHIEVHNFKEDMKGANNSENQKIRNLPNMC